MSTEELAGGLLNISGTSSGSAGVAGHGAAGHGATTARMASPLDYALIKTDHVVQSNVDGMDAHEIMHILHNLNVDGVRHAAKAHKDLGEQLDDVAGQLRTHAGRLTDGWESAARDAAMTKFEAMHEQTATLAAQAKHTAQVLDWTAGVMQQYKDLPTPQGQSTMAADQAAGARMLSGDGPGGKVIGAAGGTVVGGFMDMIGAGHSAQEQANQQARKYMTSLNNHLITANNALPNQIGTPPVDTGSSLGPAQSASSGSGAPYAGGVAGAPAVSGSGSVPAGTGASATGTASGAHQFSSAGLTQTGQGSTVTLQGYAPPPGGPSTLPPPGSAGAVPPTGPAGPGLGPTFIPGGPTPGNFAPGEGAPGGNGPGENLPGENLAAENAGLPGEAAAGEGMAGAGGAASEAAAGEGTIGGETPGMMPGMGGAGEASAAELGSGRYALREVNPDLAAGEVANPGVIGDEAAGNEAVGAEAVTPAMAPSGSAEKGKERRRQAWMGEDADIWGRPADSIPSVIEGGN